MGQIYDRILEPFPMTPLNDEQGNGNPYDHMPSPPLGRRIVVSNKLLTKRLFLDLDHEDQSTIPLYPIPELKSLEQHPKRFKTAPVFFNELNGSRSTPFLRVSLQRLQSGVAFLRLKQERDVSLSLEKDHADDAETQTETEPKVPTRRSLSESKGITAFEKSPPKRTQSGNVPLGRGVTRRNSGIARCA